MDNTNKKSRSESEFLPFDPIVLVLDVAKQWLLILLAVLIVGVCVYIKTDMDYSPVYRTTTTYVVTNRSSSSTVYSNLTSTNSLASVFSELLNSSIMRKAILQELDTTSFNGSIVASVVPETNLLTVTVTASDPRTAFLVAQAVVDHHETVTYKVVDDVSLDVLQPPKVPTAPVNYSNASQQMNRLMFLTAGAAIVILLLLSYYRNTVRSAKEVRAKLDCSFLGEIPHEEKYKTLLSRIRRRKTSILITSPVTSFRFVETFRNLRHRIEQHMHGNKVLMVTSLLENEGKSTVAVNLALAMAQKYPNVLLIDCDLRKPACYALLEKRNITSGLQDFLTGKTELSDAIVWDKKRKLYLLLETQGCKNSGDLLASDSMRSLVKWAKREFDFVVLDLPPMAAVSDAESLMELADASLLVVRQNTAPAPAINKAIASLENGKAKLLGCVLNNVYATSLSSGQGYGYGRYKKYGRYGRYGYSGAYGHYETGNAKEQEGLQ